MIGYNNCLKIKKLLLATSMIVFSLPIISQEYNIKWVKKFAADYSEYVKDMQLNHDNNTVMLVTSDSYSDIFYNNVWGRDIYLIEVDGQGNIVNNFAYGDVGNDDASSLQVVCDGYIICGSKSISNNDRDAWIFKINNKGEIQWEIILGGSKTDGVQSIKELSPGLFISTIISSSNDLDFEHNGENGFYTWFLLFDENGNIIWNNHLENKPDESYFATPLFFDNAIYLTGYAVSPLPSAFGSIEKYDVGVIKLSLEGEIIWHKTYGGSNYDLGREIRALPDGNLLVVARTQSMDRDVDKDEPSVDMWAIKINKEGDLLDSKIFGGSKNDYCYDVISNMDGSQTMLMTLFSDEITNYQNEAAVWVFDLNENLEATAGQIIYVDSIKNVGAHILRPSENGLLISYGNVIGGTNELDVFLVYLEKDIPNEISGSIKSYPNPASECVTFYFNDVDFPFSLSVFDLAGRLAAEYQINSNIKTIDVSGFPYGAYFYTTKNKQLKGVFLKN